MVQNLFCLHGYFKGALFVADDGKEYQLINGISVGNIGYMQLKKVATDKYQMVKFIEDVCESQGSKS